MTVFVFSRREGNRLNDIQLGRFGRHRSSTWFYPGVNSFARRGAENALFWHPTSKPVALVADVIFDCTKRGDIILDPFIGGGSTILGAERTGRRGFGIESISMQIWPLLAGKR